MNSDLSSQPHDAYFKEVFSQPERAAAFFRGHLPAVLAAQIDWDSLAPQPGSFVKQSLQQAHSDLLFSARAGTRGVLLYLLFEHQTTVDPAMPLRLLGYLLEIWQGHERKHGLPLPPVIPFVLHQGPDTWNVSVNFEKLIDLPEELSAELLPFLPKFSHALLDLTQFDPAKEEHHEQMRVVLQLMRLARQKRMIEFSQWLSREIAMDLLPEGLLRSSFMYVLHVDSRLDLERIYHTLGDNLPLKVADHVDRPRTHCPRKS